MTWIHHWKDGKKKAKIFTRLNADLLLNAIFLAGLKSCWLHAKGLDRSFPDGLSGFAGQKSYIAGLADAGKTGLETLKRAGIAQKQKPAPRKEQGTPEKKDESRRLKKHGIPAGILAGGSGGQSGCLAVPYKRGFLAV